MTSKVDFSSASPAMFLYIFSIYVATTQLATIFYKKMKQIYKYSNGLSLLNSAFDVNECYHLISVLKTNVPFYSSTTVQKQINLCVIEPALRTVSVQEQIKFK